MSAGRTPAASTSFTGGLFSTLKILRNPRATSSSLALSMLGWWRVAAREGILVASYTFFPSMEEDVEMGAAGVIMARRLANPSSFLFLRRLMLVS